MIWTGKQENNERLRLMGRIAFYSIIGLIAWLVLKQHFDIDSIEWGLIFAGFSGCYLGFYGGILKLYKIG